MTNGNRNWKLVWNIPRLIKTSWELLKNPHIPFKHKYLVLLLGLGYLIWPLDLIPDVPFVGHLDDIGIIFLLLNWFVNRYQPADLEADYYIEDEEENNNRVK